MEEAERVARRLAGAVGGHAHDLSAGWVVVLADGRAPVLVRAFGARLHATVYRTASWSPVDEPAVVAAVRDWAEAEAPDVATPYGTALRLRRELGPGLTVTIPGTDDPSEIRLHPDPWDAGSIGVFDGRVVAQIGSEMRTLAVPRRGAEPVTGVQAALRAQAARYGRHVAIAAELWAAAGELAAALSTERSRCAVRPTCATTHVGPAGAEIARSGQAIVVLRAEGAELRARAGAVGAEGWEGDPSDPGAAQAVRAALLRARTLLTTARLEPGRWYRVLADVGELRTGGRVRFVRYEDIDNHYARVVFAGEDGREAGVAGDPTTAGGVLPGAYRYLAAE